MEMEIQDLRFKTHVVGKQFLKPFVVDQPEAFLLPSSEINVHPTRFSVALFLLFQDFFSF